MPSARSPSPMFLSRLKSPAAIFLILAGATLLGLFSAAPVRSQLPILEAAATPQSVPVDDAWASVWDDAPSLEVPLSAQEIAFPFGGGTVDAVTVRSLYDDDRIYISMEWADASADESVSGGSEFSDAAALQFAGQPGASPPYTMGRADAPVNIWHWKAVWQADQDRGFPSAADRHPNTYVDNYPNEDDSLYNPAAHLGNPVAQQSHASPIENLSAAGFGTLTSVAVQDVEGSGSWRNGTWRVVFARAMAPAAEGLATFEPNQTALVAFAIWDGASGDRNGQKSIAQFIELDLGPVDRTETPEDQALAPGAVETGIPWAVLAVILGASLPLVAMIVAVARRDRV